MKRYSLRHSLRLDFSRYDAWRNPHAIIGKSRDESRQLDRRNANLLAHGNRRNRNLRPAAHRLGQSTGLARQLDSGLLPKSKRANVFVEPVFAEPKSDLDR